MYKKNFNINVCTRLDRGGSGACNEKEKLGGSIKGIRTIGVGVKEGGV